MSLQTLGCERAQGYAFSPSLPAHDAEDLLLRHLHAGFGVGGPELWPALAVEPPPLGAPDIRP